MCNPCSLLYPTPFDPAHLLLWLPLRLLLIAVQQADDVGLRRASRTRRRDAGRSHTVCGGPAPGGRSELAMGWRAGCVGEQAAGGLEAETGGSGERLSNGGRLLCGIWSAVLAGRSWGLCRLRAVLPGLMRQHADSVSQQASI